MRERGGGGVKGGKVGGKGERRKMDRERERRMKREGGGV